MGAIITHIPDGVMDPAVLMAGWVLALPAIGWAFWRLNKTIDERSVPLIALLAAGLFVAQMLNFPVGGGVSGHLIGAALAVILVGLPAGMVVMTTVLVIQALLFGDGGITALGLNLLNMAVIAPLVAYAIMAVFKGNKLAVPVSAWSAVFISSVICGLQLGLSYSISGGAYGIEMAIALPAMAGGHAIIGIGEGVITGGVVLFLGKVAPETLRMSQVRTDKEVVEHGA